MNCIFFVSIHNRLERGKNALRELHVDGKWENKKWPETEIPIFNRNKKKKDSLRNFVQSSFGIFGIRRFFLFSYFVGGGCACVNKNCHISMKNDGKKGEYFTWMRAHNRNFRNHHARTSHWFQLFFFHALAMMKTRKVFFFFSSPFVD